MAEPEYPVLRELETKLKLQWIDTDDYLATQRAIIEVTPDHAYLELPRGRKGDKGDPGNAISFQGVVARTSDLPTGLGASDAAKAWVNTATKALHVWNGDQWFTVNNFAGVDADVQRFSQWFAQAADAARTALEAADRAEYWASETIQQVTGDFATKNYADSKDWFKGFIDDTHLTMADVPIGLWGISAQTHSVRLGLPADYGSLQVMQIGASKSAFFLGQTTGFWTAAEQGGVWGEWHQPWDKDKWFKGAITDAHQTMNDVSVGVWNIAARNHAVRFGLPMDYGSLQVMQIGLSKTAFFIGQSTGFWINSSNGDVWGEWQRPMGSGGSGGGGGGGANGLKTVGMALTAGSLLDGVAGRHRVLAQVAAPVTRWRVHVESHRMLSNTTSAFTLGDVYVGGHSGNGAIVSQQQVKAGSSTIPADGEWVSEWVDIDLSSETLIDLDVSGSELYSYQAAGYKLEGGSWVESKNTPVSIWLELETYDQVPVVGMIGDSTGAGQGADRPVHDSALYIAGREHGFIPVAYAYPGSSMESINDYGFHLFQRWAHLDKPDSVIIQSGSNDIHAGASTAELQKRYVDLVETAEMISPVVIGATVKARYPDSGEHQDNLDSHNRFVKRRSSGNRDYVDFYAAVSPTGTVAAADAADAAHLSTSGHQKLATAFDSVTVARPAWAEAVDRADFDSALETKADKSELAIKADKNDDNIPQIKLSESLAWAVTDGTNSAISVDTEGTTKIGRIDSATSRHIAAQVSPELGITRNLVMDGDPVPFRVSDGERTALAVTADGAVDFRRLTPEALAAVAGATPGTEPSDTPAPAVWVPETTSGELRATYLPTGESIVLAPESTGVIMAGAYPTWEQDGQRWWQEAPQKGPWKVAERHRLAAWGSSSVRTYHDELTASLPAHGITDFLPGGIGSDRSAHILGRMGAKPFTLAADLTVPGSGPVPVAWLDMPTTAATASFTGTLGGIHGTASTESRNFSFTRTDPGDPVTIPAGTEFLPDSLPYRDALVLLNIAKNDINGGYMNAAECLEQNIIASEWLRSLSRRYLVLGHFRNRSWADDDPKHGEITELNRLLAEHYGDWYVDQQDYLMGDQVWDDTGLTPTSEDLACQAKGVLAPSLGPDGVHTGSVTSAAVVNHIIIPAFVQKGWIA